MPTVAEALHAGRDIVGFEALLTSVLGRERSYLYSHPESALTAEAWRRYSEFLARRRAGEPLQYITGRQEFFGREFHVTPAVLIPRPETEGLIEAALEKLPASGRVVDVGTGSGCIAVTLALERPGLEVTAVDLSPVALQVARENARRLGARVQFATADLLNGAGMSALDMVISNPPYVADDELAGLAVEVRDHEPRLALLAGPNGLEVYQRLIPQALKALRPGGWLALELGYRSAASVRGMLGAAWDSIEVRRDLQGLERVLLARAQ